MVTEKVCCPHHKCNGSGYRMWSVMSDDCEDLREDWCTCQAGVAGRAAEAVLEASAPTEMGKHEDACGVCGDMRPLETGPNGWASCPGCGTV